jgi:excisionase family DNA binding protein
MYYTPSHVADLLQVKRRTIYAWVRDKKLSAVKVGNRVRIHRDALAEFLGASK